MTMTNKSLELGTWNCVQSGHKHAGIFHANCCAASLQLQIWAEYESLMSRPSNTRHTEKVLSQKYYTITIILLTGTRNYKATKHINRISVLLCTTCLYFLHMYTQFLCMIILLKSARVMVDITIMNIRYTWWTCESTFQQAFRKYLHNVQFTPSFLHYCHKTPNMTLSKLCRHTQTHTILFRIIYWWLEPLCFPDKAQ